MINVIASQTTTQVTALVGALFLLYALECKNASLNTTNPTYKFFAIYSTQHFPKFYSYTVIDFKFNLSIKIKCQWPTMRWNSFPKPLSARNRNFKISMILSRLWRLFWRSFWRGYSFSWIRWPWPRKDAFSGEWPVEGRRLAAFFA